MAKVRQNFWGQQAAAPRYSFTEHAAEMERLARRASWLGSDGAFVVHAPREGGRGEIWYYVARPTERALRRASKYGIPVGNLGPSEQVPYRAILSNLHFYRQPESRKVLVLDTFKGSVVGPLSYSQVAKKAGGSVNPRRRNGNFEEEWKMRQTGDKRQPGETRKAHRARMRKSYGPDWWKEEGSKAGRWAAQEWTVYFSGWEGHKARPVWQTRVLRKVGGDDSTLDFGYFLVGAGLDPKQPTHHKLVPKALDEWVARGKPEGDDSWDAGVEFRGRGRQTGSPKNKTSEADWKRGDVAYYGESNTYYARRERMPTRPKGKKAWKVGRKSEWNGGDEYEWVHTKQEARDAFSELTSHRANPRRRTNKKQRFPKTMTLPGGVKLVRIDTSFGPMVYHKKSDPDYWRATGVWIEQIAPGKYRVGMIKNGVVFDATPASPFKIEQRGGLTAAQALARVKAHFGKRKKNPRRRR